MRKRRFGFSGGVGCGARVWSRWMGIGRVLEVFSFDYIADRRVFVFWKVGSNVWRVCRVCSFVIVRSR